MGSIKLQTRGPYFMYDAIETYTDVRDAVSKLCTQFPGKYWRKLDREMSYPTEFV